MYFEVFTQTYKALEAKQEAQAAQHPVLGRACGNVGSDPCICQVLSLALAFLMRILQFINNRLLVNHFYE